jgi:hypothetical protein
MYFHVNTGAEPTPWIKGFVPFCYTQQNRHFHVKTGAEAAFEKQCIHFRTLNIGTIPEKK